MGEITIDVAVIGSGAAGLTAALAANKLGLNAHIFEKAEVFGGTTAKSGGVAWLPGNHHMPTDSPQEAFAYLRQHAGNRTNDAKLKAFVDHAADMLEFMTRHGYVQYRRTEGFPDYRAEQGGDSAAGSGGRSVEPEVFASRRLGPWQKLQLARVRNMPIVATMTELRQLAAYRTDLRTALRAWRAVPRSIWGKLTGAQHLASGAALIARMAHAVQREQIPLHLGTGLNRIEYSQGQVQGIYVGEGDKEAYVPVRRGVILATGGFDHNQAMRDAHLPECGAADFSSGADTNTGDGHLAAEGIGAELSNMDQAWWAPTCMIPGYGPQIVIFERGKPGQMIVNAQGERFANEAQPYGDFVRAMFDAGATPAYMIFDQTFRDRYPIGHLLPGSTPQSAIDSGFLARADSLGELASQLGVNGPQLERTVTTFNAHAIQGEDPGFQRGEFAFDRYGGDPTVGPNPCLAPIARPPFYGLTIHAGDLGTNGGVAINEHGQALDTAVQPIGGLYAAGNCSASPLGGFYPGAGGTIGPAMTFAYIAANHLKEAP